MSFFQSMGLHIEFSDPLISVNRLYYNPLVKRLENVNNYSHTIKSEGGYYSAIVDFVDTEEGLNEWIQDGIGRHVETYNPSLERIWEGFVNQIDINFGENSYTIGPLVEIGNRTKVQYSTIGDKNSDNPGLGIREETDWTTNADSINLYGIWEKVRSIAGATLAEAEQIRDLYINDPLYVYPPVSNRLSLTSGGLSISLKCLGYWAWLKSYYLYDDDATGTTNISDKIEDTLGLDQNGIFSTDYSRITENTTQVANRIPQRIWAETEMLRLVSLGDSTNQPYKIGFYNDRVLYYEPIPTDIKYQKRRGEQVTDRLNTIVNPWDVKPGEWLFQPDMLVGRHPPITSLTLAADPRAMLIDTVRYSTPFSLDLGGKKYSEMNQILKKQGLGI